MSYKTTDKEWQKLPVLDGDGNKVLEEDDSVITHWVEVEVEREYQPSEMDGNMTKARVQELLDQYLSNWTRAEVLELLEIVARRVK